MNFESPLRLFPPLLPFPFLSASLSQLCGRDAALLPPLPNTPGTLIPRAVVGGNCCNPPNGSFV